VVPDDRPMGEVWLSFGSPRTSAAGLREVPTGAVLKVRCEMLARDRPVPGQVMQTCRQPTDSKIDDPDFP